MILLYTDHMKVMMNDDLGQYSVRSRLPQNCGIPLNQVIPQSPVILQSPDIRHFVSIPRVYCKVHAVSPEKKNSAKFSQPASCNPHSATCTLHPPENRPALSRNRHRRIKQCFLVLKMQYSKMDDRGVMMF